MSSTRTWTCPQLSDVSEQLVDPGAANVKFVAVNATSTVFIAPVGVTVDPFVGIVMLMVGSVPPSPLPELLPEPLLLPDPELLPESVPPSSPPLLLPELLLEELEELLLLHAT